MDLFLKSTVNQRMDHLLTLAVKPKVSYAPKVDLKSIVILRVNHFLKLIANFKNGPFPQMGAALDLSFGSWAFGPAAFLIRNYVCSRLVDWEVGLVTPALDLSLRSWAFGPASFLKREYVCVWTWKLGRWICHSSIGLVFLKLGLRPSFILNMRLCLFLDFKAGTLDLSLQHWTCLLEAGPSAQRHS